MMVARVARRLDRFEAQAGDLDHATIVDRMQRMRRDGQGVAEVTLVARTVHGARSCDQPTRFFEVARTAPMHEDRYAFAREMSRASCVVKMNVGDQQGLEIARSKPHIRQLRA